jgi:MFS family permease
MQTSESTGSEPLFSTNEWRIMAITSAGHLLCHMGELAFAAVLVAVMVEFQIEADRAAAVAVPGFLLFGVCAVPAGIWTDRRGSQQTMTAYFFLLGLSAWMVFAAQSLWALTAALTCLGAALSIYHPSGLAMIAQGCRHRGRAMGINGVAGSLGVALGPAMGLYFSARNEWRATYAVLGTAAILCGVAAWLLPIYLQPVDVAASTKKRASSGGSLTVLGLLFAAMLVSGFNYRSLTTALPTFLGQPDSAIPLDRSEAKGLDPQSTRADTSAEPSDSRAHFVFIVLALGGIGQIAGGFLADRFRPAAVYVSIILATIPCALVMAVGPPTAVLAAACFLAIFLFGQQPLENTMLAEATPVQWRSTVYGLKFILVFGVGSLGAYTTGIIWRFWGLSHVFDLFAVMALIMALFAAIYARRSRKIVLEQPLIPRS